jgi:hypothetical protein
VAPSYSAYLAELQDVVTYLEPGAERSVQVLAVPKTLKTPRIIAREPTCMMYAQQALLGLLTENVDSDDLLSRFVNFNDQTFNQRMAKEGSINGALATLDLSEASDRVSNLHVKALLDHFPSFAGAVDACRSMKADVPGRGTVVLSKFASMGSALCFPFEMVVFLTVIFCGIEKALKRQLTRKDIKSFAGQVRIYGDDIIVPVDFVIPVVNELEAFGLKVNKTKSFWVGKFRESCGKEYYDGSDVSIVRVRDLFPTSRGDATEMVSTVSLRNQLFNAGFVSTVEWLDKLIMGFIPFPFVDATSPALGRFRYEGHQTDEWDSKLQRPLVRAVTIKVKLPINSIDSYPALMKWFLKDSEMPFIDRNHLLRSGKPVSLQLKYGKVPAC